MSFLLRTANRTPDEITGAIEALNKQFNSYSSAAALNADSEFVFKIGS